MIKMFIKENLNPQKKNVGDCVIRAISTLLNQGWDTTFLGLTVQAFIDADMPSSDSVWNNYLIYKGYERQVIPSVCPNCITVREFAKNNPHGRYLLFVGGHVVAVVEGDYIDTWDSGDKVVIYFFQKREKPHL